VTAVNWIRSKDKLSDYTKGMLAIAFICLLHAFAYLPFDNGKPVQLPAGLQLVTSELGIPVGVFGALWAVVGFVTIYAAFKGPRAIIWVRSGFIIMLVLWGMAYGMGWLATMQGRAWITGGLYLGFSWIVYYFRRQSIEDAEHDIQLKIQNALIIDPRSPRPTNLEES
jgi:hypothetical protein